MKKNYKKNTFIESIMALILSQLIIKCIGIIYKVYITNKEGFGDTGNAIFSGAFQIYTMFLTITSIGVPNAISKLVSEKLAIADNKGAYKVLKVAVVVFGIIGFMGSAILFYSANFIAEEFLEIEEANISLMILAPSIFFVSIESVLKGYFNGRKNISITAKSQIVEQIVKIICTFLIIESFSKFYNNISIIVAGAALSSTIATIFCSIYLYKILQLNKKEIWKEAILSKQAENERIVVIIKKIMILSIPIAISGLLSSMTKTIDAFTIIRFLKNIIGEKEATFQYGILTGKIETIIALPFSFNIAIATSLIPIIAEEFVRCRKKSMNKKIEFSLLLTVLIGLFSTICIYMFSDNILKILFPNANQGAKILKISALSIIIIVLTQTINGILQGIGKVNNLVIAFSIGAIVKIIGNLILITRFKIYGAIISTIISQFISLIVCIISLNKNIKIKINKRKVIFKPLFSALVSYIIMKIIYINIKEAVLSCVLIGTLGLIVYIIVNVTIKTLEPEELKSIPFGEKIYSFLKKMGIYNDGKLKKLRDKKD